ncbi:MAG: SDR family NAD(P)-dependent oxidoreductase [Proteobacteria bacterium]|nr:SDR family NAD(P)-dependent oxidoreductase [Pseudomonadota bacterium]
MPQAIIIGNSDGIGLALTTALLEKGWDVTGISRSQSPITGDRYRHHVVDIRSDEYDGAVAQALDRAGRGIDLCVYCAGIGEEIDFDHLDADIAVFEVNLIGLVRTVSLVLPGMLAAGRGHLIGLSSQGDSFLNVDAPSYSASKAGMSSYLEALALAVRNRGVFVTNVRFGFVATKMAKADTRPFEISAEKAATCMLRCVDKRPIRYTYPRRMAALLWLANGINRVRTWVK